MDLIGGSEFLGSGCCECSLTYLGIGRRMFVGGVAMGQLLKDDFFSTAKKTAKVVFFEIIYAFLGR